MYCVRQAQSLHSWGVRRASFFGKHCFCKNWVGSMLWGSKGLWKRRLLQYHGTPWYKRDAREVTLIIM
jgi:hypothetical protein